MAGYLGDGADLSAETHAGWTDADDVPAEEGALASVC
jgi:hypothetical protein